jgi:UDP-GlcNAc3NAcA epimerase
MRKILTVVGARPQFIKAAVVSRHLAASKTLCEVMVHTGQHFDPMMSEVFFSELGIARPAHNLGIHSLRHGAMVGRMIEAIETILVNEKPSALLVYGDTDSTLAGAMAAAKLHVPVIHVEAGLRSFNSKMPEEINRIVTDRLSRLLFCPTQTAVKNLIDEGFDRFPAKVILSGDVMCDSIRYFSNLSRQQSKVIETHGLGQNFALLTLHRAETTNEPALLKRLVLGLEALQDKYGMQIVWPIHPRTRNLLRAQDLTPKLTLIDPVGYLDMLRLIDASVAVLTDSGGLQKEAYLMGKFCITLREETEWVELVQSGVNRLVGTDPVAIEHAWIDVTKNKDQIWPTDLYGNGSAGEQIVSEIEKELT